MASSAGAKRLARSAVDWAKFTNAVPKEELGQFQAFKALSDRYVSQVSQLPADLPDIDFASYKTRAGAQAAIIAKFETEYKALKAKIPYPSAADILKSIDEQEKTEKAETEKWLKESSVRVQEYNSKLSWWDTIPPLVHMSEQEWMYYFPGSYHDQKVSGHYPDLEDFEPDEAQYCINYRTENDKHPNLASVEH